MKNSLVSFDLTFFISASSASSSPWDNEWTVVDAVFLNVNLSLRAMLVAPFSKPAKKVAGLLFNPCRAIEDGAANARAQGGIVANKISVETLILSD